MQTQRRYLRVVVPVALVAAAVGLLAGGASAADGDITRLAGQYRGANANGDPVCLNAGLADPALGGHPLSGDPLNVLLNSNITGVTVDSSGSTFLADRGNGFIHQIAPGSIQTIAGGGASSADGLASQVQISPQAVATNPTTGQLYFVDSTTGGPLIRTLTGNSITTVPTGPLPTGNSGFGLAADAVGHVYMTDSAFAGRIDIATGAVTPLAGVSGNINPAAVDKDGTALYVTTAGIYGHRDGTLQKVDLHGGAVTSLRTDLDFPSAVAVTPAGDRLFVAEAGSATVTELDPANGHPIQPVAGTGAPNSTGTSIDGVAGTSAPLAGTIGLAVDANVNVYILDSDNCVLRMVERMPPLKTSAPTTAPSVTPSSVVFTQNTTPPGGLVVPPPGNVATAPAPVAAGGQNLGIPPVSAGGSFTPGVAGNPVAVSAGVPGGIGLGGGQSAPALGPLGAPTPVIPGPAPVAAAPFPLGIPPAPALVLGADAVAAANVAAGRAASLPEAEAESPKGAPRYTMVANHPDHGLPSLLFLTAFGVVGLFGCVVAAAARAEDNAMAARAGYEKGTEQFRTRRPGGAPWERPRPEAKRRGWGGTARGGQDPAAGPGTITPAADRAARRTTPASPCRPRW